MILLKGLSKLPLKKVTFLMQQKGNNFFKEMF